MDASLVIVLHLITPIFGLILIGMVRKHRQLQLEKRELAKLLWLATRGRKRR